MVRYGKIFTNTRFPDWSDPFDDLIAELVNKGKYPPAEGLPKEYVNEYYKALRQLSHADYLKTPHWRWLRKWALHYADYRCQLCNSNKNLEVHHRTYENIPDEDDYNDLIVLCNECHGHFHTRLPKLPSKKQKRST